MNHALRCRRHFLRTRLLVERLEDRTLLNGGPLSETADVAALQIDPHAYEASHILVRFQEDPALETATQNILLGATIGEELAPVLVPGLRKVALPEGVGVEEALTVYQQSPLVKYAEPDYFVHAAVIPNDPQFNLLYGLHNTGQTGGTADADIDAPEAWDVHTGSGNFLVAVIDTGVNWNHPDLAANSWINPGEIAGDGIDNDGNGRIDDVRGWNFVANNNNPLDDNGHGSHVAGTIGAVGNNADGVTGVNWRVKVAAVKFLNSAGSGTTAAAISAVNYAVTIGAKISNNSWGGGGFSTGLFNAIDAARTAGFLFVAAAGNNNNNNDAFPFYPATYNLDNIISVAASDHNDNRAGFSNNGATTVDIAAPGVSIRSTWLGTSYNTISGTSMASPHVAGAAALLWDLRPTWNYAQVRDRLFATTDPLPATWATRPIANGRLNAAAALAAPGPPSQIIDNGQLGYADTPIGTWFDWTGGYNNNFRYTDPGIGGTASWTFSGLIPGTYAVQGTWTSDPSHASDVPYRIFDGASLLQVVTINQRVEPSGPAFGGRPFQGFGTVTLTGTSLRVEMERRASGYTIADAIRMVNVPPPVIDLNWSGISGPTSTNTEATFTISRNYSIAGASAPSDFTIGYYSSVDATFGNADDVLLGSQTISAAADKTVGTHAGTSPALQITSPGTYHLFARVDNGNAIPETNETNNVAQAPAQIVVTLAPSGVIVDNGQPGYSEVGTWLDWTGGFGGNFRYADPGLGGMARWSATGLAPGSYTVQGTWTTDPSHAPNVTYRIYDGSTLLLTVTIDQRVEPSGGPTIGGRPFQTFGTAVLSGSNLRVEMDSSADGYAIADAIRIVPV